MCLEDSSHELNNVVDLASVILVILVNLVLMDLAQSVQFSSYHFFFQINEIFRPLKSFQVEI